MTHELNILLDSTFHDLKTNGYFQLYTSLLPGIDVVAALVVAETAEFVVDGAIVVLAVVRGVVTVADVAVVALIVASNVVGFGVVVSRSDVGEAEVMSAFVPTPSTPERHK